MAIDIAIRLVGRDDGVTRLLRGASDAGQRMGATVSTAAAKIKDSLIVSTRTTEGAGRALLKMGDDGRSGAGKAQSAMSGLVRATKDAEASFGEAEMKAQKFWNSIDEGRKKTENLSRSMEGIRNAGAGMAIAGGGILMASNRFIQAAEEGMAAQSKLEAMLEKRHEGGRLEEMTEWAGKLAYAAALPDDDEIVNAAAGLQGFGMAADDVKRIMPGLIGQARLYDQSLESVAEAVGRAFGKGEAGGLTRIGVTLSDADKAEIEALKDAPQAERQAKMLQLLKRSFDQYALSLTEGLSQTQIEANRTALAMDELNSSIGRGATRADRQIKGLGASIIQLVAGTPQAQESGGWLLTMSGYALTAIGSIIGLAGQIGMLAMAFPTLIPAAAGAFGAITAGAGTAAAAISAILVPIGLVLIALGGLYVAIKGTQDAMKMSHLSLLISFCAGAFCAYIIIMMNS